MKERWLNSLLMFAWLTIGYATVHIVLVFWGISIVRELFRQSSTYESLYFTEEREPIIASWDAGFSRQVYRKLDGTAVESKPGFGPKFLFQTSLKPNLGDPADEWRYRICPLNDFQEPAAYWYFVVPPDHAETGYFTGYEESSRHHIGYIDRQGFTLELPTPDRSFPVKIFHSYYGDLHGTLAGPQLMQRYIDRLVEPSLSNRWNAPVSNASHDTVWIHSNDAIYEIRLGSRTVRKLVESRPDMLWLFQRTIYNNRLAAIQLIVRTVKGISIINPETGQEQSLSLGDSQDADSENFYSTQSIENPDRETVGYVIETVKYSEWREKSREVSAQWMDADGNTERQQQMKLLTPNDDVSESRVVFALAAPLPLVSAGAIVFAPLVAPYFFDKSDTYFGQVLDGFSFLWPYLLVTVLIGCLSGWACRQRERDVFGRSSWIWPILVGVCGWFGWIAYICLKPLPARLPNREWITSKPEPAEAMGTEIFA